MLINELKEIIKDKPKQDLEQIIVMIYKSIPKKIKEEKDIDDITFVRMGDYLIQYFFKLLNQNHQRRFQRFPCSIINDDVY